MSPEKLPVGDSRYNITVRGHSFVLEYFTGKSEGVLIENTRHYKVVARVKIPKDIINDYKKRDELLRVVTRAIISGYELQHRLYSFHVTLEPGAQLEEAELKSDFAAPLNMSAIKAKARR